MNEMKINKCGCGGEVTLHTDSEFHHYRDFYYCECDNCSNRSSKYDDKEYTIQQWNTAHPEISPAMQAVKWLEEGHKLHREHDIYYFALDDSNLHSYTKNNNQLYTSNDGSFFYYASHGWLQLYEEPKYRETTAIEALSEFIKDNTVVVRLDKKQLAYNGYNQLCLLDTDRLEKLTDNSMFTADDCYYIINKKYLERNDWRIYD